MLRFKSFSTFQPVFWWAQPHLLSGCQSHLVEDQHAIHGGDPGPWDVLYDAKIKKDIHSGRKTLLLDDQAADRPMEDLEAQSDMWVCLKMLGIPQ